jgi:hypothetical protein
MLSAQPTNQKAFRCPRCGHIIFLDDNQLDEKILRCSDCNQQNLLKIPSGSSKKKPPFISFNSVFSQLDKNAVYVGLLLFLVSIISFLIATPGSFKITLTLIILAVIISSFIVDKQQDITFKITVGIILLILVLFFITGAEIEMFLILIFIVVSLVKILLDEYLPYILKVRMNLFLSVFFVIFLYFMIKRIINVINI